MISIAQAVSYELTDDRKLKAVLLDNDGNEHESELSLDDYLVLEDGQKGWRFHFEEHQEYHDGSTASVHNLKIFIHENKKWGPMLCMSYRFIDHCNTMYDITQRLNMSRYFGNDNGTLRFRGDEEMEGVPEPDEYWQMYWDDFNEVKKYAKNPKYLHHLYRERVGRVWRGFALTEGHHDEFEFVLRSIQDRLSKEKNS